MTGSGNVINYSVQPYVAVPFLEPMTFLQRLGNNAMMFFGKHFMDWQANSQLAYQKEYLKNEVGLEVCASGSVATVLRDRISLVISCSHPITHGAWQYNPNVIEVKLLPNPSDAPPSTTKLYWSRKNTLLKYFFGSFLSKTKLV